jgi:hypothetical protein
MKLALLTLGLLLVGATAWAADTAASAPAPQLISIRLQLVELHPGAAIAGGFLEASAIGAVDPHAGATRIELLTPAERENFKSLDALVAEEGARILADSEFAVQPGAAATLEQIADAPFEIAGEQRVEGDTFENLDFPGRLGLLVRVTPTLSSDGGRITVQIETASRSAETWVSSGLTTSTQRKLRRGGSRFTLAVAPETTIAIVPVMTEEDRRALWELRLADPAEQPFFSEPQLGWKLYLLITPKLSADS